MNDIEEIEGKTIAKAHKGYDNSNVVIRFADDSILEIMAVHRNDNDAELEMTNEREHLSDYDLLKLGFITEEQIEQKKRNKAAADKGRQRRADWKKYQELKELFDNEERAIQTKA